MKLSIGDLPALSLGAGVLATGGGGSPYLGQLALRRLMESSGHEPSILALADVPDDALVACVLMAGAPTIGLEKLMSEDLFLQPLRHLEKYLGRRVDALMPIEVGGMNSLLPFMASCVTGLPVLDADGMGRAFPALEKTTFAIAGLSPCPNVLVNAFGNVVIVDNVELEKVERMSRSAIVALGGRAGNANYAMSGAQAKAAGLPGTLSLAMRIGRAILAARSNKTDPVQAILDECARSHEHAHGRVLFDGKVVDMSRETSGGYNVGTGVLEGSGDRTSTFTFAFQNEYLHAFRDGRLVITVPDLLMLVDRETAEPITCETLRYGQRLKAIGIACFPALRSLRGLELCGPQSFGMQEQFVPLEDLTRAYTCERGWDV